MQNVALVDDDDDFLAPGADLLHEPALGLGKRAICRRDEENEVGARDELRRHRLVLTNDGVGPRRVDDADLAKELHGRLDGEQVGLTDRLLVRFPMFQQRDDSRRRRDPFGQQRLAEQGIDKRALACVEFAHNDEKKELVELCNGLVQGFLLLSARVDAGQRCAKPHQEDPLFAQQCFLRRRQNARQHTDRDARIRPDSTGNVGDLLKHRKAGKPDDVDQTAACMKLHPVAVDQRRYWDSWAPAV